MIRSEALTYDVPFLVRCEKAGRILEWKAVYTVIQIVGETFVLSEKPHTTFHMERFAYVGRIDTTQHYADDPTAGVF